LLQSFGRNRQPVEFVTIPEQAVRQFSGLQFLVRQRKIRGENSILQGHVQARRRLPRAAGAGTQGQFVPDAGQGRTANGDLVHYTLRINATNFAFPMTTAIVDPLTIAPT